MELVLGYEPFSRHRSEWLKGLRKFSPGVTNLRYLMQVGSIFLAEQVECVKTLARPIWTLGTPDNIIVVYGVTELG